MDPWILTDDSTSQYVQVVSGEPGVFRFIDTVLSLPDRYSVVMDEIHLNESDLENPEFIQNYLSPYGYADAIELRQIYSDDALRVAAECVFETVAYNGKLCFTGTRAQCHRYIESFVKRGGMKK